MFCRSCQLSVKSTSMKPVTGMCLKSPENRVQLLKHCSPAVELRAEKTHRVGQQLRNIFGKAIVNKKNSWTGRYIRASKPLTADLLCEQITFCPKERERGREGGRERIQARDKVHGTMRPIDSSETGPGASNVLRTAEGAQRHNDYSLHYKWLKQSRGPARGHSISTDPDRRSRSSKVNNRHFCLVRRRTFQFTSPVSSNHSSTHCQIFIFHLRLQKIL